MYTSEYSWKGQSVPAIISNDVDINTSGNYKVIYYDNDDSTATLNVTIKDKKMPNNWVPNYLEAEVDWISSLFFILKNKTIKQSEFNQIDKNNLLSKLKNPVTDNNKFKYSIDSITKENRILTFTLNVTYGNETKKIPTSWTLFFDVIPDGGSSSVITYPEKSIISQEKKNINQTIINFVNDYKYYYTGKQITPEIVVTYQDDSTIDGISLIYNQDYQISFKNNIDVDQATMTINGINNYDGYKQITFEILKVESNIIDFEIDNNKPVATSNFGQIKYRYCKNPNENQSLYYDIPNEIGKWYVQAYVDDTSNYNESVSDWKEVDVKNLSDFNNVSNNEINMNKNENESNSIIIVGII